VFLPEIRPTVRMFVNQFHPLLIIDDRDNKHQNVVHFTDLLTGTDIKGGELYLLSALSDLNRSIP